MSDGIWEERRFRIEERWLWIEKHWRELLSRPKFKNRCSAK